MSSQPLMHIMYNIVVDAKTTTLLSTGAQDKFGSDFSLLLTDSFGMKNKFVGMRFREKTPNEIVCTIEVSKNVVESMPREYITPEKEIRPKVKHFFDTTSGIISIKVSNLQVAPPTF